MTSQSWMINWFKKLSNQQSDKLIDKLDQKKWNIQLVNICILIFILSNDYELFLNDYDW